MPYPSIAIVYADDIDFHGAPARIVQQFEKADVTHLQIVVLHKLLPSASEFFLVTCTIISNGYFPFLVKQLKIQLCLLWKIFLGIGAGESLFTDFNARVSRYNGMKRLEVN
jgi:hypothetical protein